MTPRKSQYWKTPIITAHAPGPWEARRELGDWVIRRANVIYANDAVKIADVNHGRTDDEANAALIAAAPDLLAAAKMWLAHYDYCVRDHRIGDEMGIAELRAAVAKATQGVPVTDNSDGLDAKLTASLPAMIADASK